MSSSEAVAPRDFSGTSDRGNFSEALNLAIHAAKDGLKKKWISYSFKDFKGINGGPKLQNEITVCIQAHEHVAPAAVFEADFTLGNHDDITHEVGEHYVACGALGRLGLWWIIQSNLDMDVWQGSNEVHFDNCHFREGIQQIQDKWDIINRIGNSSSLSARTSFGHLLHTVQDFYAHSTWVEIHQQNGVYPIPVWDGTYNSLPTGIISGTWRWGKHLCPSGTPDHEYINKDSADSIRGKQKVAGGPNNGKTYFELAYEVARRATQEQFARFFGFVAPVSTKKTERFPMAEYRKAHDGMVQHMMKNLELEHGELDITFTSPECGCKKA
ncbi:MAG TPA: hypothetical protein PLN21_03610 [Gemmatales bacterium]|nr:hypothetical protein [Gemmatales bacterium]